MQFNNYLKTKLPFFVALSLTFVLASCGSYQYVGYDNDGIYSDSESANEKVTNTESETPPTTNEDNGSYYKAYFTEKANQYNEIPDDEQVIFTDIDSYEGEYSDENQEEDVQNGYAGWGQTSSNITINYIDTGWGFNNAWGWNTGFGWGWNNWRWNRPWGWNIGYNSWGWNYWGWNVGWGNSFWCPPGFNGYYYNNQNLAYNSGRRGSSLAYGRNRNYTSRRSNSNLSRRNSSTVSRRGVTSRRNSITRSTTRRSSSSTIRRNNTRTRSNSTVRPRTNTTRSRSNVTRPRSNNTRSSSRMSTTPRRSSSSVRSSSSSTRSSGTSRSSSRTSSSRRR